MRFWRVGVGAVAGFIGILALLCAWYCGYLAVVTSGETLTRLRLLGLGAVGVWAGIYLISFAIHAISAGIFPQAATSRAVEGMGKRMQRWLAAGFWILALLMAALFWPVSSLLVLGVYLILSEYLIVGLHELGHVIAARLAGLRPVRIRIGTGRELFFFFCRGLRVSWGVNPFSGYVEAAQGTGKWNRRSHLIFSLGGPLVSLAVFLAGWGIFFAVGFDGDLWGLPVQFLFALFLGQHLALFCGFFDAEVVLDGRKLKPDMSSVLLCLTSSDEKWESQIKEQNALGYYLAQGMAKEAWEAARPLLTARADQAPLFAWLSAAIGKEAAPDLEKIVAATLSHPRLSPEERGLLLLARGGCLGHQGMVREARECFAAAMECAADAAAKVALGEVMADLVIRGRLLEYLPEADRCSLRALELEPNEITLLGTRGSLLLEAGRLTEGIGMLEEVFERTRSENDKAISAFYLALAFVRAGRLDSAAAWRQKMIQHHPPAWLLERTGELEAGTDNGANDDRTAP